MTELFNKYKKLFFQIFKFGLVGLSNTAISSGIYYLLLLLKVDYRIAYITAFAVSVLNAYFWSSRFVFKKDPDSAELSETEPKAKSKGKQVLKTYMSYGTTALLGFLFVNFLVEKLGVSDAIAFPISLCLTIPLNFILNKFWVFKDNRSK